MTLTLRTAIDASQSTVDVVGIDPMAAGQIYMIDTEYVEVRSAVVATLGYLETPYQRTTLNRGHQGTTSAAHLANSTLSRVVPSSAMAVISTPTAPTESPPASGGPYVWDGTSWLAIVTTG